MGGLALPWRWGEGSRSVETLTQRIRFPDNEALAVLLDFGLGERIEIGDDLGGHERTRPRLAMWPSRAFFNSKARKVKSLGAAVPPFSGSRRFFSR
jgi:hypothetical protein